MNPRFSQLPLLHFAWFFVALANIPPVSGQEKKQKEIPFSQLFKEMFVETKEVNYKNVRFVNDLATPENDEAPTDPREYLRSKLNLKLKDGYFKMTCASMEFNTCTFDDNIKFTSIEFERTLRFYDCEFLGRIRARTKKEGRIVFTQAEITLSGDDLLMEFDSCKISGQFDISDTQIIPKGFGIKNSYLNNIFFSLNSSKVSFDNCVFNPDTTLSKLYDDNRVPDSSRSLGDPSIVSGFSLSGKSQVSFQKCILNFGKDSSELTLRVRDEATLILKNCICKAPQHYKILAEVQSGTLVVVDCEIESEFTFQSSDNLRLIMRDNKIGRFGQPVINSLSRLSSVSNNGINQFSFLPFDSTTIYADNEKQPVWEEKLFDDGIAVLKIFYDCYREVGQIEKANLLYIRIRDIEKLKLAQRFRTDPSFNHFFSYQLSRLLKFYTNYGTDPARAIVISFYIILLFGGFYFFFPSDWDIASKSRLIQNFQTFVQKNDKGYWRPFFILVYGLIISLLNAITLSLNAFTTLGFGNIPTAGLPRYICVLQGFIGWFLLSLFTVALINQAQF